MSYKPDIGTVVSLNTGATITGAIVSIAVKKPSGQTASWAGAIAIDNQSVQYTIVGGDITESGVHTLQAKVTLNGGTWYGNTTTLTVKDLFT